MPMSWTPIIEDGHEVAYKLGSGDYVINICGGDPVLQFKGKAVANPAARHQVEAPFWGTILKAMAGAEKHAANNSR